MPPSEWLTILLNCWHRLAALALTLPGLDARLSRHGAVPEPVGLVARLHHAPRVARGAHAAAFAEIGHEIVVPAIVAPRPGKAMGKDSALQMLAKSLANTGPWRVVVALAVELA